MRQQAQVVLTWMEGESRTYNLYVGCIVAVGEHYTLGVACRARCVKDGAYVIDVGIANLEVGGLHSGGEIGGEQCIGLGIKLVNAVAACQNLASCGIDGAEYLRHLVKVHLIESTLLGIENLAVRVVYQALCIGRGECIIKMYGYVTLADGCHEDRCAQCAALGVDGNLVTGFQAGFFPNKV